MDMAPQASAAARSEPVRRTEEIEDVTNLYFVHVLARRLTTVLARWHVSPNAVSIAGMVCGVAAGLAYARDEGLAWPCLGFALMIAWHVADGADGQLARLTHRQSDLGKVLDGVCDYVTFTAVYLALAARIARHDGPVAWLVVAVAGLCHALQAAAYERQRQDYDNWGWGRGHGAPPPSGTAAARTSPPARRGLARLTVPLYAAYERLQAATTRSGGRDRRALDQRLRSDPHGAAHLRRLYRAQFARPVRRWSILSANYRTIGIFLCALAHRPIVYFAFEIVGFSIILAVLAARQRARLARFLAAS